MRCSTSWLAGFISSIILISAFAPAVATGSSIDTTKLRDAVTLNAVRAHQGAFQSIADDNGGDRAAGTGGHEDSAAYVTDQLEAAGYDVTLQEFNFPFFRELSTPVFEQLAPVATSYPHGTASGFYTMTYSASGDVTGIIEAVNVTVPPTGFNASGCSPDDFSSFTPGRIALIQRGACFFQTKVANAEAAGAIGVIVFNEGQPNRTDAVPTTLGEPTANIPVVFSSYAIGEALYNASLGTDVTVRIMTDTISEYRTTSNVLADLPGKFDRVIIAGAHLDSVEGSPGINDNGSGAATLLEIALQMTDPQFKPRSTVRFAWWGGEENGQVGSAEYVGSLTEDELKEIAAYLELEMLGSPNFVRFVMDGDGSVSGGIPGPAGSEKIEQVLLDYFAEQGLAVEQEPIGFRFSIVPFFNADIPFGGLFTGDTVIKTPEQAAEYGGSAGDQYDPCYHLACDTFDNVSFEALEQMSDASAHLIQTFAMTSASVPRMRPRLPQCEEMGYDFSVKIDSYGCQKSPNDWSRSSWPVDTVEVGGVSYTRAAAIAIMGTKAKGDKTYALFNETVAAKLNSMVCGPVGGDIADTILAADDWLAANPPGSGIKSKDSEWDAAAPLFSALSDFNGGAFQSGIYPIDGLGFITIETDDGIYFDWTSDRSTDVVIVKGGRGASVWEYDPEAFSDIGLHAPINPKNDTPYGLSYVEFCFDWDIGIDVRKFHDIDADGEWDADEPEIGVDQFVFPDGTIGGTTGWPYLFQRPLADGGIEANLFWTPDYHEHSEAGDYLFEEYLLPHWEHTALIVNGVPQAVTSDTSIYYAGDADEYHEIIFGNAGYAELLGAKFEDLNGNTVRDPEEPGLPGIQITLDGVDVHGNVVLLNTVTDEEGRFGFVGLVPGNYSVTETLPAGWQPSTPIASGPHALATGESLDLGWVFGNYLPGSIHGLKFEDHDGDGVRDEDEDSPLSDVIIELTGDVDGDGGIDLITTVTGPDGAFHFTGLYPGDYQVSEVIPAGWSPTTPTTIDVTVASGEEHVAIDGLAGLTPEQIDLGYVEVVDQNIVFGNFEYGSIHGYKFHDLNANGQWDVGEPGLEDWTIELDLDEDGSVDVSTTTDANGEYAFTDLGPGSYVVIEALQPEWIQSTANPPALIIASGQEYVAQPGQALLPPDSSKVEILEELLAFGNYQAGSIHGYKFHDLNANGIDDGEPRLEGWEIQLAVDGIVIESTFTGPDGTYDFTGLEPEIYYVAEVLVGEWSQSTASPPPLLVESGQEYVALPGLAGLPDGSDKVEIVESLLAFGNYLSGSIHGYKFEDLNGDGVDDGEPVLADWLFELFDADVGVVIDTATTNELGEYHFESLNPGNYLVREAPQEGWQPTTPIEIGVSVASGEELVALSGLAYLPDGSEKVEVLVPELAFGNFLEGAIYGYKFHDLNADGIWDEGEPPLENWIIELYDNGTFIDSQLTDPAGAYAFTGIGPGSYDVREVQMPNWVQITTDPATIHLNSGQFWVAIPGIASLPPGGHEVLDGLLAFGNWIDPNEPPEATDDIFEATGNVGINVPAASGVLVNDSDPNLPADTISVTPETVATVSGGSITFSADGSFQYTPITGFIGADSATYTLHDSAGETDTGTVTLNVNDMIWFIDNSAGAGDGTRASPFNTLAAFNSSGQPASGNCIFIEETGTGDYNGPLNLANGQKVVGNGATASIDSVCGITMAPFSYALPATAGTRPVIVSGGNGINLAANNTVRGLNITNTTGTGLIGSNAGTVAVSEASITGNGAAIGISNAALAMAFDEVSSTVTGNEGVFLNAVTGSLEVSAGSIDATSDAALDISGTGGGVAIDLTFESISSSGAALYGIRLGNTTGTGGLTVTGDGSTAASGGTIANTPIGIKLDQTGHLSFAFMQMNDFGDFAVRGNTVDHFALSDSVITASGFNGNSAAADEGNLSFTNLTGNVTLSGSLIEKGFEDNIRIVNSVDRATATLTMVVTNDGPTPMIIGTNDNLLGNDGLLLETQGNASATLSVTGTQFTGARGDLLQTNALGTSYQGITINNTTFANGHANIVSGGGGITLSGGAAAGNMEVSYQVGNSTFSGAKGNAITANFISGQGQVTGLIHDNVIGSGAPGSGSQQASGILVGAAKNGGNPGVMSHEVVIDNNLVQHINGTAGIEVISNDGYDGSNRAEMYVTLTNNTVSLVGPVAFAGLYTAVGGTGPGDHAFLCADVRSNTFDSSGADFTTAMYMDQLSGDARYSLSGNPVYAGSPNGEFPISGPFGTASADILTFMTAGGNTLTDGVGAFLPGVDASTVTGVTGTTVACTAGT